VARVLVSAVVASLLAPFPASAATLNVAVPRLPAAPIAVLGSAVAPAALSFDLSAPLAAMPAIFSASPAAPSIVAAPAPAAALALIPAAADSPKFPENPNSPPAKAAPPSEADSSSAGASFDGSAPAAPTAPALPAAPLGSGLKMAKGEHEQWLGPVVGLLSGTRTGRRVLRDIDALAASRGRPILLDVKAIGNNGEFRYDSDLLVMDSKHLKKDPLQSAAILAHELQHVLQRALALPTDALELEIESYTVESRVWSELGVEPEAGSFARQARSRISKDLPAFVEWLKLQYKENIPLYGSSLDAYVARLEKKLAAAKKSEAKTRRKRAAVERTLESMRKNGMDEAAIEAHRREDLEPLDRSLRDGAVTQGWLERDLRMLAEPEGRARFRAYAQGVIRRARALSRS
jgi:hypothetical protein